MLRLEVGLPCDPTNLLIDIGQAHCLLRVQPRGEAGQWDMELVGGLGVGWGLSRLLRRRL